MACTFSDFNDEAKATVAPAYLGSGPFVVLPNANTGQYVTNFQTGYNNFVTAMFSAYSANGCSFWQNRVTHWTNQLAVNNYNAYITQRKQAKILFAQNMHVICGCSGPVPMVTGGSSSQQTIDISSLTIDINNEEPDAEIALPRRTTPSSGPTPSSGSTRY